MAFRQASSHRPGAALLLLVWFSIGSSPATAGVVNPDISVIGQPFARLTDDPEDLDRDRLSLAPGELELVFEAALNPYGRGSVTLSVGEEGLGLEEGFFILYRGLPGRLALKGGQYRVGFGKLNPVHPHALPFSERFRVAGYLPGEEAFIEPGLSLSELVPLWGDQSFTFTADWLQGDSFRIEREPTDSSGDPLVAPDGDGDRAEETRAAFAGRASYFASLGDQSGLEAGVSVTHGTHNVAAGARTTVLGFDAKAKLWTSANAHLVLQGEGFQLWRDQAEWDEAGGYTVTPVSPFGGYAFADMTLNRRFNAGGGYERYGAPVPGEPAEQALKLFAGLSLFEETTAFRFDWDHFWPDEGAQVNTYTLRMIFAMGPHKAHQF